jgi:hypothetical protein
MPVGVLRLVITGLLALVIPIQGIAAVTARLCATLGHHETSTPAVHDHADGHAHDAEAPAPAAAGAHCPPCVACCAAAAISASARIFIPDPPAAAVTSAAPLSFSGIQPDGLDRPPRLL